MTKTKDKIKFEPSRPAKDLYLGTRKKPLNYGGFIHPGLFQTYNFSKDSSFFWVAIILELIGLSLTIIFGYGEVITSQPQYALIALTAIFVAIGIDITLAILHHSSQPTIQKLKIERLLETSETQLELIENKISSKDKGKLLWAALILIMALLKIGFFFITYQTADVVLIAMVIAYFWVAYIHISATGFFFAERKRRRKFDKEYATYIRSSADSEINEAEPKELIFNSPMDLDCHDFGSYSLELVSATDKKFKFSCEHVLSDKELQKIVQKQKESESSSIALKNGLRFQFEKVLQFGDYD